MLFSQGIQKKSKTVGGILKGAKYRMNTFLTKNLLTNHWLALKATHL